MLRHPVPSLLLCTLVFVLPRAVHCAVCARVTGNGSKHRICNGFGFANRLCQRLHIDALGCATVQLYDEQGRPVLSFQHDQRIYASQTAQSAMPGRLPQDQGLISPAWRGPRETSLYLRGKIEAIQSMIVKEGNVKSSADLTLREFDDIQVSAVAFCAIYNTHRRVCRKLIEALEEKRQQYRQIPAPLSITGCLPVGSPSRPRS